MRTLRAMLALPLVVALIGVPRQEQARAEAASTGCDRYKVVTAWNYAGSQVGAAAEQALLGTDADVCAFLDTVWAQRGAVDDRLNVNQMLATGGPAMRGAAQQALDSTDPTALGSFLESGWGQPWLTDQRVRINQMAAAGGAQLKAAAQRALDAGTPEALRTFVESGWRLPELADERMRINQILAAGGPEVKVAAQRALDANTLDAFTRFIDVDWGVAAARDQETQTLTDLVTAAQVAGARAEAETAAATSEAQRAVAEAAAARQAAQAARDALAAAQNNAAVAAAEAQRAAQAADRAAAAAQEAVAAARAASAAARVAAGAAARAAAAAVRTREAAARAYQAAAAAATSAANAQRARDTAAQVRAAAEQTKQVAEAARRAAEAAFLAYYAASEAGGAASNANASAQAAQEAYNYATAAGANAAAARAAAARARANAGRATRAANAAAAFANTAADAAYKAQDAANRAVENANAAAAAAEDAANHAGEAAQAAARATAHANAATQAAQAAVDAANQAKVVYEAARTADAERIRIAFEQGDEAAIAFAAEVAQQQHRAGWDAEQAARRSAETNRLIAEATNPATPRATAVLDARKVALALARADGSFTRAAANDALAGSDALALEFVRTGIAAAAGQDDRATLGGLMVTGSEAMRAAARQALDGSDADVAEFLRTRDYPGRLTEDRLAVNQILAAARAAGDVVTADHAQRALDAGTDAALRQFLETDQYVAGSADKRVKVSQILASPDSGPELKAAAQIALDGPPAFLDQFLNVQRYAAAQRDQDTDAHNATVAALLAQATNVAEIAVVNALKAQGVAATARGAAEEATRYAQQATDAAIQAGEYAQQAQQSAAQAQTSANRAAASARTAASAANSANVAARQATRSAAFATISAARAADYAHQAYTSARQAYDAAVAAHASAEQAAAEWSRAATAANELQQEQMAEWAVDTYNRECLQAGINADECLKRIADIVDSPEKVMLQRGPVCAAMFPKGSDADKACLADTLNPNFEQNLTLTLLGAYLAIAGAFVDSLLVGTLAVLGLAGVAACPFCAAIMQFVLPGLMPEFVGLPFLPFALEGLGLGLGGLVGGTVGRSLAGLLELTSVEAKAGAGGLGRLVNAFKDLCRPNSFAKGTPVLLADGTSKSIEDVRVGDRVLATDPVTGTTRPEPVTATITGSGPKHLVDVTIDTDGPAGHATAKFTATDGHPFWVADLGQWVDAGNLHVGQWLRTGTGTWVQITRTQRRTETTTVFNLTVADLHTYYVVGGRTPVLVHNAGCIELIPIGADRYRTPAGLEYGPGSVHGHRIFHVMSHGLPDPTKPAHSVYLLRPGESILGIVDEAWLSSQRALVSTQGIKTVWVTDMGRIIGTRGEKYICVVVKYGVDMVTAFPSLNRDCTF
jgi:Pretoxin HINT domain/Short repeats of unknown function